MESKGTTRRKSTKASNKAGGEEIVKKPKSSRNTEKRRERSKVAARCRRGKESEIFSDLSSCLPVTESSRSNLDKASVMRLTLCDLKLKQMMENIDGFNKDLKNIRGAEAEGESLFDGLINSAVSGFVLVCSCDGDVIYVSEGIASCLGLSQYEVMGQSLFEFSHPCDQADVKEMLLSSGPSKSMIESRSALFRLKSANSSRGRNVHHRSTNYKVVSCFGRIFSADIKVLVGDDAPLEESQLKQWFVGICEPLLCPSDVDIPLNHQSFLSKHSLDMKFEYVDENTASFMGYKSEDMIGKSLFDFYHACDGDGISRSFKSLYTKGQTATERTRFLAKGGGWIWVVTQATTINNNAGKPTSVVCIHFVTSGLECDNEIVSQVQLKDSPESEPVPHRKTEFARPVELPVLDKKPLHESTNLQKNESINLPKDVANIAPVEEVTAEPALIVNPFTGPIISKPTPSTTKIFAPRTPDMETGFLMPVQDTKEERYVIVTKEEPVDLTHLAPIAGDECVPLSNVPLLEDLLQWLDDADMEYTVLEGYEEPFPLPLISAATGGSMINSPIPSSMVMSSLEMRSVVKEDVIFDNPHSCDSPLLLQGTDPTLLSSCDPMLLSPFKTPSPEPFQSTSVSSPSCAELMSPDMFSAEYYAEHDTHGGRGGGTAGASSHKSKAGGGYDDHSFSGFPMVSDFQENLFSPVGYSDGAGPPGSPEALANVHDRGGGGLGTLKLGKAGQRPLSTKTSPSLEFDVNNETNVSSSQLKCVTRGSVNSDMEKRGPPFVGDRPLPYKIAKSSYTDEHGNNKAWLQIPSITPPQPPWEIIVDGGSGSPSRRVSTQTLNRKGTYSITIGTQTQTLVQRTARQELQQHRQRQLQKYRQLLMNPALLQALLNQRLRTAASGNGATVNLRKRNFVGKLLADGVLQGKHPFVVGLGGEGSSPNGPGGALFELPKALVELTDQDCEVNAPLNSKPLLDGPDLLTALDT